MCGVLFLSGQAGIFGEVATCAGLSAPEAIDADASSKLRARGPDGLGVKQVGRKLLHVSPQRLKNKAGSPSVLQPASRGCRSDPSRPSSMLDPQELCQRFSLQSACHLRLSLR